MTETLVGWIREAIRALNSLFSLGAFVAWWIVLSLTLTPLPPLVVFLFAALLGSATGAAIESALWQRSRRRRADGVVEQIEFLWEDSLGLPPRVGRGIRQSLYRAHSQLKSGAISPEAAQRIIDDSACELGRASAAFLEREEAGEVTEDQHHAILRECMRDAGRLRPVSTRVARQAITSAEELRRSIEQASVLGAPFFRSDLKGETHAERLPIDPRRAD